ncbi:hypothetical protein [Demequina sp. NBRC 110053]|uniref:hypothetical protein n=1 Tax=Demequina sp. NBRC 110053 TaxID=1570342 RepID=UPI000A05192D|nr:hypothetical protein [Demequina sp. NBRC 110053]
MSDLDNDRFIAAKQKLSAEQITAIVAERKTFLPPEVGSELAVHGAATEEDITGEPGPTWVVAPEFRDFLKRSL